MRIAARGSRRCAQAVLQQPNGDGSGDDEADQLQYERSGGQRGEEVLPDEGQWCPH